MPRFFLELAYKGTSYAGFQIQQNANTVQEEVEKALKIYFRKNFELTGSSRTDAGVHALQNFFHFDFDYDNSKPWENVVYHLNAILPDDIVIRKITEVDADAHCRFDALSRSYEYVLYNFKNPFLSDTACYFPYPVDFDSLNKAAEMIKNTIQFESFSKKHTQVHTFICSISESLWVKDGHRLIYKVRGNRFLRGMVRGLVGTMLRVGTGKIDLNTFQQIIDSKDANRADFSMPAQGLTLVKVDFGK